LLKVFKAIYSEMNLTRAASELSLSQPAVSHSLSKLRDFFEDPLFVREGNLMLPTKRAEAIYENVKTSLKIIETLLDDKGQNRPSKSSRTFTIGISNYASITILPKLLSELYSRAPDIKLETKHVTQKQKIRFLEDGDLDLVIGTKIDSKPSLKRQNLFSDEEVCIVGPLNKVKKDYIDIKNINHFSWIRLQASNQDKIDIFQKLDAIGVELITPIMSDQELVIPSIVSKTTLVGIVAKKIALEYKGVFDLKILSIKDIETKFSILQYWHMTQDNDPIHRWFRKLVKTVCEEIDESK